MYKNKKRRQGTTEWTLHEGLQTTEIQNTDC